MKVINLKLRNVFNFGNGETFEISFDKPYFTQLTGKNGTGKTSLKNCLTFGLYGDSIVGVGDIPNEVNGDGYISVEYISSGRHYVNEWHFNPTKLSITEDGKPLDFKGVNAGRQLLRGILDVPYEVFTNNISINIDEFRSYLNMSASDIREIRDKIFGFGVVNSMLEMARVEKNRLQSNLKSAESQLESIAEEVQSLEQSLEQAKVDKAAADEARLEAISVELKASRDKRGVLANRLQDLEGRAAATTATINYITSLKYLIRIKVSEKRLEELTAQKAELDALLQSGLQKRAALVAFSQRLHNEKLDVSIADIDRKLTSMKEERVGLEAEIKKLAASEESLLGDLEEAKGRQQALDTYRELEKLAAIDIKPHLDKLAQAKSTMEQLIIDGRRFENAYVEHKATVISLTSKLDAHAKGQCGTCGTKLDVGEVGGLTKELEDAKRSMDLADRGIKDTNTSIEQSRMVTKQETSWLEHHVNQVNNFLPISYSLGDDLGELISSLKPEPGESPTEIKALLDGARMERDGLSNRLSALNSSLLSLSEEKSKLQSQRLPTEVGPPIPQGVTADNWEKLKADVEVELAQANSSIKELQAEMDGLNNSLYLLKDKYKEARCEQPLEVADIPKKELIGREQSYVEQANELAKSMDSIRLELVELGATIKSLEKEAAQAKSGQADNLLEYMAASLDNKLEKQREQRELLVKIGRELLIYEIVEVATGNDGIKGYCLNNIVPYLNYEIARATSHFGAAINFEVAFDNNFNPIITRNGAPAKNISTGQKKLVNFAILMAMYKIIRVKYGKDLNILFYDELVATLDNDNVNLVLDFIKSYLAGTGISAIIVNHQRMPPAYFDRYINIKLKDGFSVIEEQINFN